MLETGKTYTLMDPDAIKEVEYLRAMHKHFVWHLAKRYKEGEAVLIAHLCDDELDHSGRLLGEVRDCARERPVISD